MVVERLGVAEFLERGGAFLLAREAEHNLLLGLAIAPLANPRRYGSDPYLAVVEADGRVVAAALRTPPYGLVLSEIDDARAVDAIAADVHDVFDSLPGVLGPVDDVRRFVEIWQTRTGRLGTARRRRADLPGRLGDAAGAGCPGVPTGIATTTASSRWAGARHSSTRLCRTERRSGLPDIVDGRARGARTAACCCGRTPPGRAGVAGRVRSPTPNGIRHRPRLHPARAARPRLRECARRRADRVAARGRAQVLLPLHEPRQPDLELDLPAGRATGRSPTSTSGCSISDPSTNQPSTPS